MQNFRCHSRRNNEPLPPRVVLNNTASYSTIYTVISLSPYCWNWNCGVISPSLTPYSTRLFLFSRIFFSLSFSLFLPSFLPFPLPFLFSFPFFFFVSALFVNPQRDDQGYTLFPRQKVSIKAPVKNTWPPVLSPCNFTNVHYTALRERNSANALLHTENTIFEHALHAVTTRVSRPVRRGYGPMAWSAGVMVIWLPYPRNNNSSTYRETTTTTITTRTRRNFWIECFFIPSFFFFFS